MSARAGRRHADSPAQRRVLAVLLLGQLLAGAGLSGGVTVGALLAADIFGSTGLAGLPAALFTGGSALAAVLVGRISQARGRRPGLVSGFVAGALGALGIVAAAEWRSVPLLVAAFLVYGSGTATNLQARYAGADLASPERRASALSTVLLGTTAGAVAGPNLVGPTGRLAEWWGMNPLSGPFLLAALAYGAAALVLALLLRPDPLLEARRLAGLSTTPDTDGSPAGPVWTTPVLTGVAVMTLTQLVMVALMTMTPVHMAAHGHHLTVVGFVISLHIAAMYLPAPLSGLLVDRFGPRAVALGSGLVLALSGGIAALAPADSRWLVTTALVLLGLGWSMGLVAGTIVLTSEVPVSVRASVQGRADVAVALSGAAGGLGSGVVFDLVDYAGLGTALAVLSLLLVAGLGLRRPSRHQTTKPPTTNAA